MTAMKKTNYIRTHKFVFTIFVAFTLLTITFSLSACSGDSDEKTSADPTQAEIYSAYSEFLNEQTDRINNYTWQKDATEVYEVISKPVALYDINQDGISELFVMLADDNVSAYLHIYTYSDGAITELEYSTSRGNSHMPLLDEEGMPGVSFVVYASDEPNEFFIYYNYGDGQMYDMVEEFSWSEGSEIESGTVLKHVTGADVSNTADAITIANDYFENNADVGETNGQTLFSNAFSVLKTTIIYSGYTDSSLFDRVDPDSAQCMSLDSMLETLAAA